ncbi:NUDIX domain-containing protein [Halocatena halophila]|uniref:NUDIX domain-containing protein n=1 Tax=Halocatena halophila TaxID=2814576 RepID=UPI002ED672C8
MADNYCVNVEGAVYRDGAYLIGERAMEESHAGGQRSLIGGTVESDVPATAALESTLQREIREETTVEIEAKRCISRVGSSKQTMVTE